MSNKHKKVIRPKDTLSAVYLHQRGFFFLSFETEDGETKTKTLHYPFFPSFDFNGSRMKRNIDNLAEDLQEYGIKPVDIENAIVLACKKAKMKAPKYLR